MGSGAISRAGGLRNPFGASRPQRPARQPFDPRGYSAGAGRAGWPRGGLRCTRPHAANLVALLGHASNQPDRPRPLIQESEHRRQFVTRVVTTPCGSCQFGPPIRPTTPTARWDIRFTTLHAS